MNDTPQYQAGERTQKRFVLELTEEQAETIGFALMHTRHSADHGISAEMRSRLKDAYRALDAAKEVE